MRVIAGNYRGRKLKTLQGENTRPTTDKVKEAIFNRIGPFFDGEVVLDLFSGSASLGIEAVSRGASKAYLVDKHFQAIKVIEENVLKTKEEEKFHIYKLEANLALKKFAAEKMKFDLIFLDPPYALQEIETQILTMEELQLFQTQATIVCETDKNVLLPENIGNFELFQRAVYGITAVTIYKKEAEK